MTQSNLFWGMQFRTCKNFWDFADSKSSLNLKNSYKYKSHTAITSIVALLYLQILRIVGYRKIYTIHKIRTFFNKQSNSSICGGSFVFGGNFGDKTRLGVCCSPKFPPSAKGAPKDEFNNAKERK